MTATVNKQEGGAGCRPQIRDRADWLPIHFLNQVALSEACLGRRACRVNICDDESLRAARQIETRGERRRQGLDTDAEFACISCASVTGGA